MNRVSLAVVTMACAFAVPCNANDDNEWEPALNNTISINYERAEQSEYFNLSYGRAFGVAGYARIAVAHEELDLEQFDTTRSYSVQLQGELSYPWLASFYADQWDGADAVETTRYELQIDRLSEIASIGLFAGVQDIHLTGEQESGRSVARDFTSSIYGAELRYYPTYSLEFVLRYSYYAHKFNVNALNIADRPSLILLLSPDSFGVIDSLDNWSWRFDSNFVKGAWLWGAQITVSQSAIEELQSVSTTAYTEYEFSSALTLVGQITQQRTESFEASSQLGVGARFSF